MKLKFLYTLLSLLIIGCSNIAAQQNFKTDISTIPDSTETGCLSGDCVDGFGKIQYDDGDVYEGYFVNSYRQGFGKYWYIEGDYYEGLWESGSRQGLGYYIWPSGNKYIGFLGR